MGISIVRRGHGVDVIRGVTVNDRVPGCDVAGDGVICRVLTVGSAGQVEPVETVIGEVQRFIRHRVGGRADIPIIVVRIGQILVGLRAGGGEIAQASALLRPGIIGIVLRGAIAQLAWMIRPCASYSQAMLQEASVMPVRRPARSRASVVVAKMALVFRLT